MVKKVRWSPRAVAHLDDICTYIARDSELYASIFAAKVLSLVKELSRFPQLGRTVPEYNNKNLRERIYGHYRIVYRLKDDFIEVAAICHRARLIENI